MPSRVIRGEINRSDSLAKVSIEADLTFRALLVAVDDFGRLDARPAILKADLFPLRNSVTPEDVVGWIQELAAGDDPPVIPYEVDGRPYLWLTGHEKHRGKGRRAQESRYPPPPSSDPPGNPRKSEETHADPPGGYGGKVARDEGRVAGDVSPAAPEAPAGRSPLLNLISKLPGGEDEKRAWLEHHVPLIEAEVDKAIGSEADPKKRVGELRSIIFRYYRAYAKAPESEREFFDVDRKERMRSRVEELQRSEGSDADPPDVEGDGGLGGLFDD